MKPTTLWYQIIRKGILFYSLSFMISACLKAWSKCQLFYPKILEIMIFILCYDNDGKSVYFIFPWSWQRSVFNELEIKNCILKTNLKSLSTITRLTICKEYWYIYYDSSEIYSNVSKRRYIFEIISIYWSIFLNRYLKLNHNEKHHILLYKKWTMKSDNTTITFKFTLHFYWSYLLNIYWLRSENLISFPLM